MPGFEGNRHLDENQAVVPDVVELPQRSESPEGSESTRAAELAQQPHAGDRERGAVAEMEQAGPRPDKFVPGKEPAELLDVRNGNFSQSGMQPQISTPVELPVSPPSVGHSSVSQNVETAVPLPPIQPPRPLSALSPRDAPRDPDLEALRRRERDLLASISAAETLERLRREHREVQEQIRQTEAGKLDAPSRR
ncbi:hypothetical protein H2200_008232 [Cladophialophora chaetospira]|uniref:Uncharacterized protein n=1 Tax=Cladophialophora chaetospira TaxID=386627 RepID=A0AA38X5D6_9EURO|nr:hypothetical protein H2200_008232 [Cladophialophora chaetospira]